VLQKMNVAVAVLIVLAVTASAQQRAESFMPDPRDYGRPAPDNELRRVTLNLVLPGGHSGTVTVPEGRMVRLRREADGATVALSPIVVNENAVRLHVLNIYTRPDGNEMVKELEELPLESGAATTPLEVPVTWAMEVGQGALASSTSAAEPVGFGVSLASVSATGAATQGRPCAGFVNTTPVREAPERAGDPIQVGAQSPCFNCCVNCGYWVCACAVCLDCGKCCCEPCCPAPC
jgi:hypothetical protein